ncbi:hypothetical protein FQA39_LY14763 [Lamprigera yunnana]|nr:hypothetical protein FQA39_LY14763 [Lamprigera yunnana]
MIFDSESPTSRVGEWKWMMPTWGSRDNISIVLVVFPGVPSPSQDAIKAEQELDAIIEGRVKEVISEEGEVVFSQVLQKLISFEFEGLSPRGGLAAKRSFIEEIFKELCPMQESNTFDTMWKPRQIGSKTLTFEMIEEKKILRIEDMCGNEVYLG